MKPHSVAHLSINFFPILGGTERFIHRASQFQRKRGIRPAILTLSLDRRYQLVKKMQINTYQNVPVITWPSLPFGKLLSISRKAFRLSAFPKSSNLLANFLKKNFEILHFHDEVDLSLIFRQFSNYPSLLSCHTYAIWHNYYRINPIAKKRMKRIKFFHVLSRIDKVKLQSILKVPSENIFVIPHSIDTKGFDSVRRTRTDEKIIILNIARIEPQKCQMDLVKAVNMLVQEKPFLRKRIECWMGGPISTHNYNYYYQLCRFIREKKMLDLVKFLGPVSNVPQVMKNADFFVHPSQIQGARTFGLTCLEALASGLPLITTDEAANPGFLEQHECGFTVRQNDIAAFKKKIELLINDEEMRKSMGENAKKATGQEFPFERIQGKIISAYKAIIDSF